MKSRLWPWRRQEEPPRAELPEEQEQQSAPAKAPPRRPASAFSRPYVPGGEAKPAAGTEPPTALSLTVEEARTAIRAAGGDVMQVGFLARAYQRQREEEPESRETAMARQRLSDLVAKRLKDRGLLAREGRFELLDEPAPRDDAA